MDSVEVSSGIRGKVQIRHKGYVYSKGSVSTNLVRWRCAQRMTFQCKGAVSTTVEPYTNPRSYVEHNHPPLNAEEINARQIRFLLNAQALLNPNTAPTKLIASVFQDNEQALLNLGVKVESIKRSLRQSRLKNRLKQIHLDSDQQAQRCPSDAAGTNYVQGKIPQSVLAEYGPDSSATELVCGNVNGSTIPDCGPETLLTEYGPESSTIRSVCGTVNSSTILDCGPETVLTEFGPESCANGAICGVVNSSTVPNCNATGGEVKKSAVPGYNANSEDYSAAGPKYSCAGEYSSSVEQSVFVNCVDHEVKKELLEDPREESPSPSIEMDQSDSDITWRENCPLPKDDVLSSLVEDKNCRATNILSQNDSIALFFKSMELLFRTYPEQLQLALRERIFMLMGEAETENKKLSKLPPTTEKV